MKLQPILCFNEKFLLKALQVLTSMAEVSYIPEKEKVRKRERESNLE